MRHINRPTKVSAKSLARPVYVVDGARTPFLRAAGVPGPFTAGDLALAASKALLLRTGVNAGAISETILGCAYPGSDEANIARIVALRLGCSPQSTAWTVQRNCASGMQAIDAARSDIAAGRAELVLAGGCEAMSHYPLLLGIGLTRWLAAWRAAAGAIGHARLLRQLRPALFRPVVSLRRGLTDPVIGLSMGQTAEELATRFDIGRDAMDDYAVRSHRRLAHAVDDGLLDEIAPLYAADGRVFEQDLGLRRDTTRETLATLSPAFDRPVGRITAGNSAQISDGAAVLLLASQAAVENYSLPVLGQILDGQWAGVPPALMGLGPVHAMAPLLERHGLETGDIGVFEINEAFAAQVLACLAAWASDDYCRTELGRSCGFDRISPACLNPDGGGISLGHPVGASGARIVLHALKTLRRTDRALGIAALCIGGGQGGALLLQAAPKEAA